MDIFDRLCPAGPQWTVPWPEIRDTFDWVRRMTGVPQYSEHHAEGDVETHTRMACEALAAQPSWRALPRPERVRMFTTVLMHDVAKPDCTQHNDDGRITARGHPRRGDLMVRRILWDLGAPPAWREHVAALVRHHQVPFWALERPDLEQIVFRASLLASNSDLAMLATADILGRICTDTEQVLDNIALYQEYCTEQSCLDTPRRFPSDHARFMYFRTPGRDPSYAAYDDTRLTVTVMSGLPGVGKDTWIARNRPGLPVISLDALRTELGVKPTGDQGAVIAAAHEQQLELQRSSDLAAREPRFALAWTWSPTMDDQTGWQSFTLKYTHGPDMLNDVKIIPLSDAVDWLRADEPWSAWDTNGEPKALSHPGLIRGMTWQIECRLTEAVAQIALSISSRSGADTWTVTVTSDEQ